MTTDVPTATTTALTNPVTPAAPALVRRPHVQTVFLLTLRWVFLFAVTGFAFHKTLLSLLDSTREGSLNGFVWLMPVAAVIAAIGVARRHRTELPIHDRQTDVIVGILGLGFAIMLQAVLLQRYSEYFHLLRIDLVAMWFFVTASSAILFGLRPVVRFAWVWVLMLLTFPVGYQLTVIFFGGNRVSAAEATLVIAAAATAVSVGRSRNRAVIGAVATLLVGMILLVALAVSAPDAPLFAFQMLPASLSMVGVGLGMFFYARRGRTKRWLGRSIEPLAARQVWAGAALVLAVATVLSLVNLPTAASSPARFDAMTFGRPLALPTGWQQTGQIEYPWVRRVYGRNAGLIRQEFLAETGNPKWDKFARPRRVVVDSTSTWQPFSLQVYPATVLYDESSSRFSDPEFIDLGNGVTAALVTIVDDKRFLTYNLLTWTWRNRDSAQRVMVAAVDNHEAELVFPEPTGGMAQALRTMIAVFFRGNQATWDSDPTFKDRDLLTEFGRGLVEAQLRQADPS